MNASDSLRPMFYRVGVLLLSLAATVVVALPSMLLQGESWGDGFASWSLAPTLVLGNGAAWGACLLAVAVAWRAQQHPATSSMVLFLCLSALAYGVSTLGLGLPLAGTTEARIIVVRRALALALLPGAGISLMRLAVRFPDEFIPGPSDKQMGNVVFRSVFRVARRDDPWLMIRVAAVLCFVAELVLSRAGEFLAVALCSVFAMVAASVFQAQYRQASQGDRPRILWMAQGTLLAISIPMYGFLLVRVSSWSALPFNLGGAEPIAYALGPVTLVLCWTIAVFLHGAMDPALVIRRSTMIGAMSLLLIFLFAGVESLISDQVSPRIGLPQSFSSAIAGGIVALAFVPLNKGLKKLADRYLPTAGGSIASHVSRGRD